MTGKAIYIPIEQMMPIIMLQLEQGGKAPLQVTGSSMYPMLRDRKDSVILEPIAGALGKGDLIFYHRQNGAYILHRIVKVAGKDTYICCGDNQYEPEQVTGQQVIARVTAFTRKEKTCSVTDPGYRWYVRIWTALFPLRRPLLTLRRKLGKLRRALRRRRK